MATLEVIDRHKASAGCSAFIFQEELRDLLGGCSERTLARWIRRKRVPAPIAGYPGRRLAWPRASTEAWLNRLALVSAAADENC